MANDEIERLEKERKIKIKLKLEKERAGEEIKKRAADIRARALANLAAAERAKEDALKLKEREIEELQLLSDEELIIKITAEGKDNPKIGVTKKINIGDENLLSNIELCEIGIRCNDLLIGEIKKREPNDKISIEWIQSSKKLFTDAIQIEKEYNGGKINNLKNKMITAIKLLERRLSYIVLNHYDPYYYDPRNILIDLEMYKKCKKCGCTKFIKENIQFKCQSCEHTIDEHELINIDNYVDTLLVNKGEIYEKVIDLVKKQLLTDYTEIKQPRWGVSLHNDGTNLKGFRENILTQLLAVLPLYNGLLDNGFKKLNVTLEKMKKGDKFSYSCLDGLVSGIQAAIALHLTGQEVGQKIDKLIINKQLDITTTILNYINDCIKNNFLNKKYFAAMKDFIINIVKNNTNIIDYIKKLLTNNEERNTELKLIEDYFTEYPDYIKYYDPIIKVLKLSYDDKNNAEKIDENIQILIDNYIEQLLAENFTNILINDGIILLNSVMGENSIKGIIISDNIKDERNRKLQVINDHYYGPDNGNAKRGAAVADLTKKNNEEDEKIFDEFKQNILNISVTLYVDNYEDFFLIDCYRKHFKNQKIHYYKNCRKEKKINIISLDTDSITYEYTEDGIKTRKTTNKILIDNITFNNLELPITIVDSFDEIDKIKKYYKEDLNHTIITHNDDILNGQIIDIINLDTSPTLKLKDGSEIELFNVQSIIFD